MAYGIAPDSVNKSMVPPGSQQQSSQSTSQTTFQNPELVNALAGLLSSMANFGGSSFQSYISNPTTSPIFQSLLQGAFSALTPSENLARRNLTDQFRAAGGLRSGAYGNSANLLEESILNQRGRTLSDVLGQTYQPTLNAMLNPVDQISALINALKGTTSSSSSTGASQSFTPNYSGGGGGGGGSSTPYYDMLATGGPGMNVNPDILYGATGGSPVQRGYGAGQPGMGLYDTGPLSGWDFGGASGGYAENQTPGNPAQSGYYEPTYAAPDYWGFQ